MLIAESGSTKTAWRLLEDGKLSASFQSAGINPNVLEQEVIEDIFRTAFGSHLTSLDLEELHFYGAGIGSDSQKGIIRGILQKILPHTNVFVEHDVLAAARATRRKEGIVCILGTGSNSALHRNFQLDQTLGGHGYIFGDEGSGMDLGKHLIKGILQGDFPDEAREHVERRKGKSAYEIKITIHHSSKPNVRMAELAQLVGDLIHIPEVEQMVIGRFQAFLDTTVVRYDNYQQFPVDFIGSIAYYFKNQLQKALDSRNAKLGHITQAPIDNLVKYHLGELL
jgi:N-acetylglucosamine kinase-like BadF-type ATPase